MKKKFAIAFILIAFTFSLVACVYNSNDLNNRPNYNYDYSNNVSKGFKYFQEGDIVKVHGDFLLVLCSSENSLNIIHNEAGVMTLNSKINYNKDNFRCSDILIWENILIVTGSIVIQKTTNENVYKSYVDSFLEFFDLSTLSLTEPFIFEPLNTMTVKGTIRAAVSIRIIAIS